MGLIIGDLYKDKTYWVISDPFTDIPFILPKQIKFIKYNHIQEDNRFWNDNTGSYLTTMIFEDNIRIPLYDSGMKTGHKITKGYYVGKSSQQVIMIMKRIAFPEEFDIEPKEGFDYYWFRKLTMEYITKHPELMI